jgi:hypothetical protein
LIQRFARLDTDSESEWTLTPFIVIDRMPRGEDSSGIRTLSRIVTYYPPMAPAILNMGRYIETIRPPTTTPRNTIIMGSIIAVKFSTA